MDSANLKSDVLGRNKAYYSIHRKMITQNLEFDDVYDIIAFRMILDTIPQCYEALGIIHALWKPIDRKFKDYIARPKPNMYQSLHTTVRIYSEVDLCVAVDRAQRRKRQRRYPMLFDPVFQV